jgi:peptidoglycan-associated lipoprotein
LAFFNKLLTKEKNMKTTKLIYPLVFALAITLAATGCKHKPASITPLPQGQGMIGEPGPATLGERMAHEGIPTAATESFDNMAMDRAALAADTVHFAFDSSVVRKIEKPLVAAVAAALNADATAKLLIEGHCDERGTEEYNRALGERRALALREALAKLGIDPARVRTISYGEDRPVDPGHDEAAWAKNRRGEFVLLHPRM